GHINITGGEPFFREDIGRILEYLGENREYFTYAILSNGSFIDDAVIRVLKESGVSFIQLSIDGNREMHDHLRAEGDYDRVLRTAEFLENNGISTYISFTANRENYRYLPHAAAQCRKRKITKLWSDRLVPIGNGQEISQLAITRDELPDYIKALKRARGNFLVRALYPKTQVTINRALQFQNSSGNVYSCSAGNSLITVDEFGNIMPCRRMPIVCGNISETTLKDVYYNNETFRNLRINYIPEECAGCRYAYFCRGGARCQSYAQYGSYLKADPACPIAFRQ
ncbi:MAG: SPASM domain-containing protein, partial [Clostridia bacterium]|nr:SPASM domain-containing protein [Clostridia bacterium]